MATGKAIAVKALTQLKSTITKEDDRAFLDTRLADIWREARIIEQEQAGRRDLRYMKRLEPYLQTLESYASVLEVFCQGYPPMAFIWGPIKLMLQLARNYTNVMDSILQAFSEIAQVLPRLDKLKAAFGDNQDFDQAVGLIYSDLIEFHQRAYKFFRCKGWHFWFSSHWGLFERRFSSIIRRLSRHCELLDREAAVIHFSEMKEYRVKHQLEEEESERRIQSGMSESVLRWLSAAEDDQEENLYRMSDLRQPETCNWVLEDPQMEAWIGHEGGEPVLWMTGIPGAGKSVLCSLIIQNLQIQPERSSLYYFCGKRPTHEETCAIILRTLTIQLLQNNQDMIPLVHQTYLQKLSTRSLPAMKKLLCQILATAKVTRVVIDGIDECDPTVREDVLKSLLEAQRNAGCNCKILISSREEPQIERLLLPKSHLKLGSKTSEGLDLYIAAKIKELVSHFPDMGPGLLARVQERLHSKAKGMYLWVRLVIAMLLQEMSEKEVERAIDQLPKGLDEAYSLILSRINSLGSTSRDRAFKILYWVCTTYRPVTTHEVADGIVLQPGQQELSRNTRSQNVKRDIVDLCAPLLEQSKNGILDVVHFSAKEYLSDKQSGPFIDIAKAHLNVALSCIINMTTALDLIPQHRDAVNDLALETRVAKGHFGLLPYGHEFWAEHTLAYLSRSGTPDADADAIELVAALESLSRVHKHPVACHNPPHANLRLGGDLKAGLTRIQQYPPLYHFVSGWLMFKSRSRDTLAGLDNANDQQQWKLRTDETFLSLIELRFSKMTENILLMSPSELPSHIAEIDYTNFIQRFRLPCRFFDCNHSFENPHVRDTHEATHVPSYPCLQCDFVQRGFKTRKDLDKHTQRYHMGPEDFEVPASLHEAFDDHRDGGNLTPHTLSNLSRRWNDEGRRVLQQGFRRVLANIESHVALNEKNGSNKGHKAKAESIREKIEMQHYECLSDFKDDLQSLAGIPGSIVTSAVAQRSSNLFNDEVEEAMSEYPVFAHFDRGAFGHTHRGDFSDFYDQSTDKVNSVSKHEEAPAAPVNPLLSERKPYWSMTEEEDFPELLHRCGRDFIKIAGYLKTKTAAEVEHHLAHLVELGRTDLAEVADRASANLQRGGPVVEPTGKAGDSDLERLKLDQPASGLPAGRPPPNNLGSEGMGPYVPEMQDLSRDNRIHPLGSVATKRIYPQKDANDASGGTKPAKRKPRPRALCPQCNAELHDEYAVKRHILRFHTATRKVWICEDISIDKKFLSKCKSCSASKRYSSRHHAANHLRQAHFSTQTSVDTLHRWMRETDEPNPSFRASTPEAGPELRQRKKRQKTETNPAILPPILFDPSTSKPDSLPPIITDADQTEKATKAGRSAASSSDSDNEQTENDRHQFLMDVSFDNVVPRLNGEPRPIDKDGPPHRANQTLIKPDQVPRLPHLDAFRRAACQDQVDALYQKLDSLEVGSGCYSEELRNLISLSQTLMSNLRDWRRHSNFGPYIPPTF